MGFFDCCHHCAKRHEKCHSECPEYKKQKALWEAHKKAIDRGRSEEALKFRMAKKRKSY